MTAPDSSRRGRRLLCTAVGLAGFCMALQMALNTNFLVDEIRIGPARLGYLEACRESCGIAAFGFLALAAGWAEPLIGAVTLVLLAVGLSSYAFVHSYGTVVLLSLVWSQGLHVWMPLPNSMMLSLAEPGRAGHRLGQMGAAGAVGSGVSLILAWVLLGLRVPLRAIFPVAGAAALLGAVACLCIPRGIRTPSTRLVFRRRYGLYYLLCLLEGWRKQVFLAFAAFLLVRRHGTSPRQMLLLWMIVNLIGWMAAPRVGRLIDRLGERRILVFYFSCLIWVFVGYAFMDSVYVLYGLFILDSSFFVFNAALTTYVNRIAPREEHTATLSMGVAMNHVAAVSMPFVGGLIWERLGHQWTFLVGAVAAAAAILAAARIPFAARPALHTGP
ncbi:MAG: Major Facilitator Superfamily protein [Lentisphaerae bacterium ADurb.BinA184]|nr:MAG: Major Facilitator Superfamily protein [Lentisphaerae bacterium ADurb.BinA184]